MCTCFCMQVAVPAEMAAKTADAPSEQANGTVASPDTKAVNGLNNQAGDKRSRRPSASPSRRFPDRGDSQSPVRSPSRHKHSKRHKKEHSHKKSKRNRHGDAEHDDDRHEVSDTALKSSETAQQTGSKIGVAPDDLDALRQAALQVTKSAVTAEPTNGDTCTACRS